MPLINCEIWIYLSWSTKCILPEISITTEVAGDNPEEPTLTTGATFQLNNAEIYVPVLNSCQTITLIFRKYKEKI